MPPKRKSPGDEGGEENEQLRENASGRGAAAGGVLVFGGVSQAAAAYQAVRKPFKVRLVAGCCWRVLI